MGIEKLKHEIANLSLLERRHLVAYIVVLNCKEDDEFMRKMAEKMDDNSPERWLTLGEAENRLGLSSP